MLLLWISCGKLAKGGNSYEAARLGSTSENGSKESGFQLAWGCSAARHWQQGMTFSHSLLLHSRRIFYPSFLRGEQERYWDQPAALGSWRQSKFKAVKRMVHSFLSLLHYKYSCCPAWQPPPWLVASALFSFVLVSIRWTAQMKYSQSPAVKFWCARPWGLYKLLKWIEEAPLLQGNDVVDTSKFNELVSLILFIPVSVNCF